jgi:hypothetical protein
MHSIHAELRELEALGVPDGPSREKLAALEPEAVFSVHEELRFVMYAAVAAIMAGVGLLIKGHLEQIGTAGLIAGVALAAAGCYATAVYSQLRGAARSIGGDYVLLLGALLLTADVGYAESRFSWFGPHASWLLLLFCLLHALTAYALDSRLLLATAFASLAAWFGIAGGSDGLLLLAVFSASHLGMKALACAGVIALWRVIHRFFDGPRAFEPVMEQFAALIALGGALALCAGDATLAAGLTILLLLSSVSIAFGLRGERGSFIVYGVVYAAVGLCILEGRAITSTLLAAVLGLATVIAAAATLWRLQRVDRRMSA